MTLIHQTHVALSCFICKDRLGVACVCPDWLPLLKPAWLVAGCNSAEPSVPHLSLTVAILGGGWVSECGSTVVYWWPSGWVVTSLLLQTGSGHRSTPNCQDVTVTVPQYCSALMYGNHHRLPACSCHWMVKGVLLSQPTPFFHATCSAAVSHQSLLSGCVCICVVGEIR